MFSECRKCTMRKFWYGCLPGCLPVLPGDGRQTTPSFSPVRKKVVSVRCSWIASFYHRTTLHSLEFRANCDLIWERNCTVMGSCSHCTRLTGLYKIKSYKASLGLNSGYLPWPVVNFCHIFETPRAFRFFERADFSPVQPFRSSSFILPTLFWHMPLKCGIFSFPYSPPPTLEEVLSY